MKIIERLVSERNEVLLDFNKQFQMISIDDSISAILHTSDKCINELNTLVRIVKSDIKKLIENNKTLPVGSVNVDYNEKPTSFYPQKSIEIFCILTIRLLSEEQKIFPILMRDLYEILLKYQIAFFDNSQIIYRYENILDNEIKIGVYPYNIKQAYTYYILFNIARLLNDSVTKVSNNRYTVEKINSFNLGTIIAHSSYVDINNSLLSLSGIDISLFIVKKITRGNNKGQGKHIDYLRIIVNSERKILSITSNDTKYCFDNSKSFIDNVTQLCSLYDSSKNKNSKKN